MVMSTAFETAKDLVKEHLATVDSITEGAFARLRAESGQLVFFATMCAFFGFAFHLTAGWKGALALALSIVPALPVAAVGLWLDRNEPEPSWLLFRSFLWGAGVATIVSGVLNSAFAAIAGPEAAVVLSAPVVEEGFKGMALLWLFRKHKTHLNSRLDACIYALFIGLGFALVENVDYYWQGLSEGGIKTLAGVVLCRGIAIPFVHPLFTLATALGVVAGSRREGLMCGVLPLLGYLGAVFLHSLWNSGIGMLLYIPVGIPAFIWISIRVFRASRREGRLVQDAIREAVLEGTLPPSLLNGHLISKWTSLHEWIQASRDPFHPSHQGWRIRRLAWLMSCPSTAAQLVPEKNHETVTPHLIQKAAQEVLAEQIAWHPKNVSSSPQFRPIPPPLPLA
jgi:RsiW-degrading membrane proteinase PrsW (M82 family)